MPKQMFYEPLIQEEQESMQIRGFHTDIAGTYVLMDDVVSALREYAQSLEDPNDGALVHGVATWLSDGAQMQERPAEVAPVAANEEIYGAEHDDVTPDVDRVELFPVEEVAGKRKWYARSVDTAGNVMKVTNGSFDKTFVEKNARDRWPGITIHEVQDENERSMFKERGDRGHKHLLMASASR